MQFILNSVQIFLYYILLYSLFSVCIFYFIFDSFNFIVYHYCILKCILTLFVFFLTLFMHAFIYFLNIYLF